MAGTSSTVPTSPPIRQLLNALTTASWRWSERVFDALALLNPDLPETALDDAFRNLTRPEGATLEARNRVVHRLLVDGVTVEYRDTSGAIRGAKEHILAQENGKDRCLKAVRELWQAFALAVPREDTQSHPG